MDNQRVFIWLAVAIAAWLNYDVYQRDYGAPATPAAQVAEAVATAETTHPLPQPAAPAAAADAKAADGAPANPVSPPTGTAEAASEEPAQTVHVRTDVLDVDLSNRGGEVLRADLLNYPQRKDNPDLKVRLFDATSAAQRFVFQSGLLAAAGASAPDAKARYTVPATEYLLTDGTDTLTIPFTWTANGVTVVKTFTLHRGHYAVEVRYDIRNDGPAPFTASLFGELIRHYEPVSRSMWNPETYAYRGPAFYSGAKYQKINVEKPADSPLPATPVQGGWAAAMQHHFVAVFVPKADAPFQYAFDYSHGEYAFSAVGSPTTVAPGSSGSVDATLYVGPKLKTELEAVAPSLTYTNDYGVYLTLLARPLFWLLSTVHRLVGNWGLAIILSTFIIKLLFYKLAETSGRSMARMRNLQPRMKDLQERYKDNREELGKHMMELYKKEKINPLLGCLPMLVQIPVFIAFYWVLLESVEMRQAPFMLWIQDLSSRDPLFILPAIMGLGMYAQFKLNPAPPDPMQAKIFAFMPVVMTATMAFFPAGLVLYWITNTGLSILQQWRINKLVEAETAHRARH